MRERGLKVHLYNSIKGIYYQLRAAVYFTSVSRLDVNEFLIGNAIRINLWHGVGLKKISSDNKIGHENQRSSWTVWKRRTWKKIHHYPYKKEYVLSTSETMTNIFAGAFRKSMELILQLGQPRNDVFFNEAFELDHCPIQNYQKFVILYMPTHRNEGRTSMNMDEILDLKLVNEFCLANNALFFIKKHYYHSNENENISYSGVIKDITQTDCDSQQLLKHADLLITDYSSCFVDYLLLNRPIVFYNYDQETYKLNDREFYFDYDATTPGPKVKNTEELLNTLNTTMIGKVDSYEHKRDLVKNIFYAPNTQTKVGKNILEYVREKIL